MVAWRKSIALEKFNARLQHHYLASMHKHEWLEDAMLVGFLVPIVL